MTDHEFLAAMRTALRERKLVSADDVRRLCALAGFPHTPGMPEDGWWGRLHLICGAEWAIQRAQFRLNPRAAPRPVGIRLEDGAAHPARATDGAAGYDLAATRAAVIEPGQRALIHTGVFLDLPAGMEAQVRPRSGLALKHGVTVLNAPGTIDSDYRGEVRVLLVNHGPDAFRVLPGDRVAQLVFARVEEVHFTAARGETTGRGAGGFGSTGVSS